MSATDDYLAANKSYAENFGSGGKPMPPAKKTAVVACMDAGIEPSRLLGLEEGDANVIRNAGGVVSDDVIWSLAISQRLLGTREIILIHHTDCGMLTFKDDELKAQIEEDTDLRPPFAMESFSDLEADVQQSIRRIKTGPFVPHRDQVRGFIYDVETGRLNEVIAQGAGPPGPSATICPAATQSFRILFWQKRQTTLATSRRQSTAKPWRAAV